MMLIYEMLNSEGEKQFVNLFDQAKAGTVTKEDFIRGILQQEFVAYSGRSLSLRILNSVRARLLSHITTIGLIICQVTLKDFSLTRNRCLRSGIR